MIKYTVEQKKKALEMLATLGPHKTQEATGIPPTTLYRWKRLLDEEAPAHEQAPGAENMLEADPTYEPNLQDIAVPEAEDDDDMNTVNERLIKSLMDEVENLNIDNNNLKRENDQFRRMLVILLER